MRAARTACLLQLRAASVAASAPRVRALLSGSRAAHAHLHALCPALPCPAPQAVSAVANSLIRNAANSCWEEGALLARVWNMHTGLMDSAVSSLRHANADLEHTVSDQATKLRR